jgi:AcrR family transcriptional regulator
VDDDVHDRLVATAYELLCDAWTSGAVAVLGRDAVAKRTGINPGDVARCFPDDAALEHEVLSYALDPARSGATDVQNAGSFRSAFDATELGGIPPSEVMMAGPMQSLDELCGSPLFSLYLNLWVRGRTREDLQARVGDAYRQMHRRWVDMPVPFEERLVRYGRKLRPPFDADNVTTVFVALLEGLALRRVADDEAVPLDLAGHVVNALFQIVTAPEDDDRTLADLAEATDRAMMATAHARGFLGLDAVDVLTARGILDAPEAR